MITKYIKNIAAVGFVCCMVNVAFTSCNDFIDVEPQGVISEDLAMSQPDEMVTSAYAKLGDDWYTYPFNLWPYGDVSSDDAMKGGSGTTDTNYHPVEVWSTLTASTPDHMDELWYHFYCSISRCNRALVSLAEYGESKLGAETTKIREGEVRFLRAHFYFKLVQLWYQVPWVDEEVYKNHTEEQTPNNAFSHEELMQKIIDDFKFAYDVLPTVQPQGGRANKTAAAAYLAKCYLTMAWGDGYEANTGVSHINQQYMQEVVKYTDVVKANPAYGYLEDFGDIFLPEYKNSKESVFAVQHSDYQNAFKTKDGLPMFDDYNKVTSYPTNGVPTAQKWDPRLFHTVGMPSFPYKYETSFVNANGERVEMMTKDNSRTPNTYGYYASMKEVPQRSHGETFDNPWQAFAMNDYVIRYTDVMLMRAEALNSVAKHIAYAADQCEIALYPASYFSSKEQARKCLQWERRLELAMECGRYFDLRRWGIASQTLNKFFEKEKDVSYDGQTYAQYYKDAHFTAGKNEYFPLPYIQLFYVPGLYTQNKGY